MPRWKFSATKSVQIGQSDRPKPLWYMLSLFSAAPDYLMRTLQVQQMAAARAVLGPMAFRWSSLRILSFLR